MVAVAPAPILDDEHKATTLERRLDAAILAAGATPPRGLRAPTRSRPGQPQEMVPLRLENPFTPNASKPPTPTQDVTTTTKMSTPPHRTAPEVRPTPRLLQFLPEQLQFEHGRPELTGTTDDSIARMPVLEPVSGSTKLPIAVGVQTNVYRLRSVESEDTPARPLPALEFLVETRKLQARDKVVTKDTLDGSGIAVSSFSSDDFVDEDDADDATTEGFGDPDTDEREGRAPAAIALPALSDEEGLDVVDDNFGDLDDLDELAAQLGLTGVAVPRSERAPAPVLDAADDDEELGEVSEDDVELVAVASNTDPFGAVVMGRIAALNAANDEADDADDEEEFDDVEVTGPRRNISLLPSSLFDGLNEDDDTPARGSLRPAIIAPNAVRFVVAEAPARPRHEALSTEERARNKLRARDLYLVAMDDLGDGDPAGAVVHLELALAYDDETSLYGDLLSQLKKKLR